MTYHAMFAEAKYAIALALSLLVAASAHGQDAIARILDIQLNGVTAEDCKLLKRELFLIRDGNDGKRIPLEPAGVCAWRMTLSAFDTKLSYFSLRLGQRRTECHKAKAEKQPQPFTWIGKVDFDCCMAGAVQKVTLTTTPPLPVSYLRVLEKSVPGVYPEHPWSEACVEDSPFTSGSGTIEQVQFEGETIRLQLNRRTPKRDGDPGLDVNLLQLLRAGKDVELTIDDIVWRLSVQRAKGRDRSRSSLSTPAIAIDSMKLSKMKLENLIVSVKK